MLSRVAIVAVDRLGASFGLIVVVGTLGADRLGVSFVAALGADGPRPKPPMAAAAFSFVAAPTLRTDFGDGLVVSDFGVAGAEATGPLSMASASAFRRAATAALGS